jgi:hypothetical protein
MTEFRTTDVNSVEYRTLTNRIHNIKACCKLVDSCDIVTDGLTSKEKGEMHDILRRRREKYRQSGKYNNMILKAHNRERNTFDKKRVPFHLRKYTYFEEDENI